MSRNISRFVASKWMESFMKLHRVVLVALSIATAGVCLADEAPSTAPTTAPSVELAGNVSALVAKLADPVWREREKAEKSLVAMGPSVLALLRQTLEGNLDDEARHRIESAIVKIEEQDETGASSINMDATDMPAREFFAALSKQIRAELQPAQPDLWQMGNFNSKATFHFENASFWEVMKEVQEKYNLDLVPWNDGVRLVPGGNGNAMLRGPGVVSGPFKIVAQQVYRAQTADLVNGGGTQSEFLVRFMGFCEPKLRLMQASSELQLQEAIDENGNSLLPGGNNAYSGFAGGNNGMWNFNARLKYPENNPGHRIVRLKGVMPVVLQTGYESLEIDDPLSKKNIQKTLGNVYIEVKDLVKNGDRYTLRLSATVGQENYQRIQSLVYAAGNGGDIRLLDDDGRRYQAASRNVNQNNNTFEATIDFISEYARRGNRKNTEATPAKLIIRVPTTTKNVTIPLEFQDIPIP
jgi:hypothetical protein